MRRHAARRARAGIPSRAPRTCRSCGAATRPRTRGSAAASASIARSVPSREPSSTYTTSHGRPSASSAAVNSRWNSGQALGLVVSRHHDREPRRRRSSAAARAAAPARPLRLGREAPLDRRRGREPEVARAGAWRRRACAADRPAARGSKSQRAPSRRARARGSRSPRSTSTCEPPPTLYTPAARLRATRAGWPRSRRRRT